MRYLSMHSDKLLIEIEYRYYDSRKKDPPELLLQIFSDGLVNYNGKSFQLNDLDLDEIVRCIKKNEPVISNLPNILFHPAVVDGFNQTLRIGKLIKITGSNFLGKSISRNTLKYSKKHPRDLALYENIKTLYDFESEILFLLQNAQIPVDEYCKFRY